MTKLNVLWSRTMNSPGAIRNAATVAAMLVIGLASSVYIVSHYGLHWPGEKQFVFSADFEKAPGVRVAAQQTVQIAGVNVGRIVGATPAPEGRAELTFSVDPSQVVYRDARLSIHSSTPLNTDYVTLWPGTAAAGRLPSGAVIPVTQTERYIQPYEVLNKLNDTSQVALTALLNSSDIALANAAHDVPTGLNAADGALRSFRPLVVALDTRRAAISRIVTMASQIATAAGQNDKRLASLVASLQTTLAVVNSRDSSVSQTLAQLPGFSSDLQSAMGKVTGLTSQLNPTLASLGKASGTLPQALQRITSTFNNARLTIEAARPVVRDAGPVIQDLRPIIGNLNMALFDLLPTAGFLPDATSRIVPWLPDLAAFVYQTSSAFSLSDANGGLGRAHLTIDLTNPTGGLKPNPNIPQTKAGR